MSTRRYFPFIAIAIAVVAIIAVLIVYYFPRKEEAVVQQILIVGTTYDPKTLDPALAYDIASVMIIQNIYDSLVGYKPGTTELEPKLAEKWEPNANATEWVFYLRKNVKFHDGAELTAEIVKQSVERVKNLQGPPAFLVDVVDKIEVVDKYTIKFVLKHPFAPFPSLTAFTVFAPTPPNATDLENKPIGTGPFKLESWIKGQQLVLVVNKEYWRGPPKLEKIIFRFYPDPSSLRIALEKGEIDLAIGIQPSDVPPLLANPDIKVVSISGLVIEWLGMNQRREPLNNTLIRKAINYAIDYDYIINNILKGTAERLYGPLPPGVTGYDPEVEKYSYKYDPQLATKLLEEAGYPKGAGLRELELIISTEERPERGEVAALIQSNLEKIGIKVKIVNLDWSTFLERLFNHDFDLYMVDWFPDYVDPDDWITPLFSTQGLCLDGYNNSRVDELALLARQLTDLAERIKVYKELQKIIIEDAPWAFLYVPRQYVFMQKNVEGFVLYPAYYIDFYPVYKTS